MFHWPHRGDTYRSNMEDSCVQISKIMKVIIKHAMFSIKKKKSSSFLGTDGLMPVNLPFFQ